MTTRILVRIRDEIHGRQEISSHEKPTVEKGNRISVNQSAKIPGRRPVKIQGRIHHPRIKKGIEDQPRFKEDHLTKEGIDLIMHISDMDMIKQINSNKIKGSSEGSLIYTLPWVSESEQQQTTSL